MLNMHYHLRWNKTLEGLMFDLSPQLKYIKAGQVLALFFFFPRKVFPHLKIIILTIFSNERVELANISQAISPSLVYSFSLCLFFLASKESWDKTADVKAQPFVVLWYLPGALEFYFHDSLLEWHICYFQFTLRVFAYVCVSMRVWVCLKNNSHWWERPGAGF